MPDSRHPRHGGLSRLVQRRRPSTSRRRTRSPPTSKPRPPPGPSAASSVGARLYEGACAVCHEVGGAPLFGSRPSLALNSNLHSAVPDNLIQLILHGIATPASSDLGYMPAFKDSLTDGQVAELVSLPAAAIRPGQAGLDRNPGDGRSNPAGIARRAAMFRPEPTGWGGPRSAWRRRSPARARRRRPDLCLLRAPGAGRGGVRRVLLACPSLLGAAANDLVQSVRRRGVAPEGRAPGPTYFNRHQGWRRD